VIILIFLEIYQKAGYKVNQTNMMRKALSILNKNSHNIIVAEFIFAPKSGIVISNLDSLFAIIASRYPKTKLILFVHKHEDHHLEKLCQRYGTLVQLKSLFFPIQQEQLQQALTE
jgi:hypothetical protein